MATKTGGGLLGGADAQLVTGAYRAELANKGLDMSGVYKLQAENIGNLQTAIQDIFYATNKSNNDLYNDIKEQSGLILADIESGTFSDDTSIDLYTNAINDLRNQAKSIPKGKKGEAQRAKIRAQLAKMKADSANGEGVITEIAALIDNDQISQYAVNENDLKLFKDILSGDAKREIINGELVYSTVDANNNPIKINHNELNKRFIKKDYTVETNALKLSGGFSKIGLQGTKYDFNEALNSYENLMTTRDGFMHLINRPFGTMKISFAQALQGGDTKLVGEMMGALNSIGGVDVDGDGTPDQITKENYKKLADILTNPDAANFSVAKRAAAAFYADNDGRAQHKKGYDIYLSKLPPTPGENESGWLGSGKSLAVLGGNRYLDYNIALDMYNSFKQASEGKNTSFNVFDTKYDFDAKTNQWSQGEDDDKDVFGNSEQFRKSMGISAPEFKELTARAAATEIKEEENFKFKPGFTDVTDEISDFIKEEVGHTIEDGKINYLGKGDIASSKFERKIREIFKEKGIDTDRVNFNFTIPKYMELDGKKYRVSKAPLIGAGSNPDETIDFINAINKIILEESTDVAKFSEPEKE